MSTVDSTPSPPGPEPDLRPAVLPLRSRHEKHHRGGGTSSKPDVQAPSTPGGKRTVAEPDRENSLFVHPSTTIKVTGTKPGAHTLDDLTLMLRKAPTNLFPLLLAPIDGFYCCDDSPRFPMTSIIHMDFEGVVSREPFERALEDALIRHPLLRAHIRPAKRGLPCWVPSDQMPPIDWASEGTPVALNGEEQIDLSQEVGIRFWIRTGSNKTRITVQVHHACTDGTGVYRFLGDLLALYGMRTTTDGKAPELEALDPSLLRTRRRRMSELANDQKKYWQFVMRGLCECFRVFAKCVQPLAAPANSKTAPPALDFPHVESFNLTKAEHEELRAVAGRHGAMLNDLLMAEMFRTSVRWNAERGLKSSRSIRIMMPSDLRGTEDYALPASNLTAYTFLARRRHECEDVAALVRSIREETGRIKNDRLGTRFADAITLAEYKPWVLPYLLKRNWCIATTTLSNVGDPSKRFTARFPRKKGRVVAGNLILDHVCGVPPLRNKTHATLAIFSYRRQLTISVRCNPYLFREEDTRAFLAMYEAGLRSYLTKSESAGAAA